MRALVVADTDLPGHDLVGVATWPDTTVDGIPFVAAEPICQCGRYYRACGGLDEAHAAAVAGAWHEMHRRVVAGRNDRAQTSGLRYLPGNVEPDDRIPRFMGGW